MSVFNDNLLSLLNFEVEISYEKKSEDWSIKLEIALNKPEKDPIR